MTDLALLGRACTWAVGFLWRYTALAAWTRGLLSGAVAVLLVDGTVWLLTGTWRTGLLVWAARLAAATLAAGLADVSKQLWGHR